MKTIPILMALLGVMAPLACMAEVKKVKIYHVPWNLVTSVAMSADEVRRSAAVKIEVSQGGFPGSVSPNQFVLSLDEQSMKENPELPVRDLRLVIDIEEEDGSISSFYASRFAILSLRSGKKRAIDEAFRARFSSWYERKP